MLDGWNRSSLQKKGQLNLRNTYQGFKGVTKKDVGKKMFGKQEIPIVFWSIHGILFSVKNVFTFQTT